MHMDTHTTYIEALWMWAYMQKHLFHCLITLQLVEICLISVRAEFENWV